ncbi:EamA family transporter [Gordonia otitidis]|uniref:Amino acid efflux protein n=1 Tax=Gordonia otitidis (strain DSM 44809 / CCUG 52243 / JCM 12355 / NBRC 100426 / IFM 10032) TaxID=1108044 RepID=H5THJ9_GORO1|nr:EamA family transporter [Gordonia otitidis]UEA60596.1 EamA family transporter [Gordonia otitidis]GAB32957.1 putative amino acid efflux protein [Gordonia otitidis NBRC 100426]
MTTRDRMLALTVVVLWGLNFIAIRLGLDHFPPFFFAALRFAVMAVPVVLFVRFPRMQIRWFLLYAFGFGVGQFAFLFLAMNIGMPTGLASLVLQTSAPFTVLLGVVFLRERLVPAQVIGIVIAVAGIVLIGVDRAGHSALGIGVVVPIVLTVLAGLSWAFGNIGNRLALPPNSGDALRMTLWMTVVPPIPLYLLSLVVEGPAAGWHSIATVGSASGLVALGGLAYVVLLGTIAGSGLWTSLMQRYPASRVAPMSLLVPVVGITAAWLFLGEQPTYFELGGAALVIAGCAAGVLATPRSRARISPSPASSEPGTTPPPRAQLAASVSDVD